MNQEQPANTAVAAPVAKKHASPFVTDGYRHALDRLNRAFTERLPSAILTGEDHSGLSYIISSFLDGIEDDVTAAHITEPCTDATAGIRKIVHAFGFESHNMDFADLQDVIGMFLSLQKMDDRRTVICIDKAQDYGRWVFDEVYRLVELEMEGKFGLMVILTGRSALDELLSNPPLSAIPADVGPRITLAPFTLAETKEYIRWRIESGGHAHVGHVFETEAITLIHDLTEGVPDVVSNLCNQCLLLAENENTARVSASIVISATQQLRSTHTMQLRNVHTAADGADGMGRASGRLIVRVKGQSLDERTLNRGSMLIGRDSRCDIQLRDPMVSRRHAKLVISSEGVALSDLGSRNGTHVNGRRIDQHMLQDNDVIDIGLCRLDYVVGDNGPA